MSLEQAIQQYSFLYDEETPAGRSGRIGQIIYDVFNQYEGNAIEIGGGIGETTIYLLNAAKKYNRKILVIDPFEGEMPKGYGDYKYEDFLKNTAGYHEYLIHCKEQSCSKSVCNYIEYITPICFAFIDGLQLKEAVISDLKMISFYNPEIICIDDVNRNSDISQVPQALDEWLPNSDYKLIKTERNLIEGYLIRK